MNFELYRRYNEACSDHHAKMRDHGDRSGLYKLEALTSELIKSPESTLTEVRSYSDSRAMYIAQLINLSTGDERAFWVDALDQLIREAYDENSIYFDSSDLRLKLSSMRRFMHRSKLAKLVNNDIIQANPQIQQWERLYLETKEKCVVPNVKNR